MARFEETFPPYVPFGSRSLRAVPGGLRGTDVAVFQALFNVMNDVLATPIGPPIAIDGVYGASSVEAAHRLQEYFRLPADGVVGPATFRLLGQVAPPSGGPLFGSRVLRPGDRGTDVVILQNRINLFRYAQILGGPADGIFGPATAKAVLAYKQDAVGNGQTGLSSDSVVGPGTYDALFLYTFAGGRTLSPDAEPKGIDVAFIQSLLGLLGWYSGPVTGLYDAVTVQAVRAFQRSAGLNPNGVVGPDTFYQLGLMWGSPAPLPFPVAWPPQGVVRVLAAPLTSATQDHHPYGMAAHVINVLEGFESLDVVGNFLPDPTSFGSQYGQYAFTLTGSQSRAIEAQGLMVKISTDSVSDWAGSFSPGVKSIPPGDVAVMPTPAGSAGGPYGPVVLRGHLGTLSRPLP